MRYVRWFLVLVFAFCIFKCFVRRPFYKDLPILLLPELNAGLVLQKAISSVYDEALDPRPICIQTENNFSLFSGTKNLEEMPIVSRLKGELSLNEANLFSDKVITPVQKDFTPTVIPVWAKKHVAPIRIEEATHTNYSEE